MKEHDLWKAAIDAAAKVINEKRHATHLYGSDEIAQDALRAALQACVWELPSFATEDQ